MTRTQIYLPKNQLDTLRAEAHKKRSTISEIVRTVLRERFPEAFKLSGSHRHESLIEAADRINSIGQLGPRDLSSRADEYLYGND